MYNVHVDLLDQLISISSVGEIEQHDTCIPVYMYMYVHGAQGIYTCTNVQCTCTCTNIILNAILFSVVISNSTSNASGIWFIRCVCVCLSVSVCVCVHVHLYVYTCTFVCTCTCMCVLSEHVSCTHIRCIHTISSLSTGQFKRIKRGTVYSIKV